VDVWVHFLFSQLSARGRPTQESRAPTKTRQPEPGSETPHQIGSRQGETPGKQLTLSVCLFISLTCSTWCIGSPCYQPHQARCMGLPCYQPPPSSTAVVPEASAQIKPAYQGETQPKADQLPAKTAKAYTNWTQNPQARIPWHKGQGLGAGGHPIQHPR